MFCTCNNFITVHSKREGTPIRRKRSKSIEDIQRHMARSYVSHVGAPKTDLPDPQFSRVVSWMNACLRKLGRGSSDHSLLILHKSNRFRRTVKKAVKSKYPCVPPCVVFLCLFIWPVCLSACLSVCLPVCLT